MTLEEKLREIALRSELTHISITPAVGEKGKFEAKFCPASSVGYCVCVHADPVTALMGALEKIRLFSRKPRASGVHLDEQKETEPSVVAASVSAQLSADEGTHVSDTGTVGDN